MKCPVCNVDLLLADRQGIEIDYCPKCRGLWLDRGELDKLIERSEVTQPQPHYRSQPREAGNYSPPPPHRQEYQQPHAHSKHKRKSFLSEIFDFD